MSLSLPGQILNLVFEIRNVHKMENAGEDVSLESEHRRFQLAKIAEFIEKNEAIHMVLPAFPAKSPNPRKTVSSRPDYGEVLALKRLQTLCENIGEIYEPGALITICSDGRVFSDVVQVSDGSVDVYGREIREIIDGHGLKNLATFSLDDVFSAHNYDFMRARLVAEFAETLESLQSRVKTDFEAKALFNGIHRFMFEDQLALYPEATRNSSREKAKHLAYEVIRRSNAWSKLVERKFPEALRLSIHPQSVRSTKIGIRLLPSNDLWRTPWHSVTVFDGKDFYLSPREQVESQGGILTYAEDKYPFYVLDQKNRAVS